MGFPVHPWVQLHVRYVEQHITRLELRPHPILCLLFGKVPVIIGKNTGWRQEVALKGAGGSQGGIGRFFLGLAMLIGGGYLFFNSIHISHSFSFGSAIFRVGRFPVTSGLVLLPFIFGVGFIFYNSKNILGWVLAGASLVMLGLGVISSIDFRMQRMSAFNLIMILTLFIGGLGLFLSSLRGLDDKG